MIVRVDIQIFFHLIIAFLVFITDGCIDTDILMSVFHCLCESRDSWNIISALIIAKRMRQVGQIGKLFLVILGSRVFFLDIQIGQLRIGEQLELHHAVCLIQQNIYIDGVWKPLFLRISFLEFVQSFLIVSRFIERNRFLADALFVRKYIYTHNNKCKEHNAKTDQVETTDASLSFPSAARHLPFVWSFFHMFIWFTHILSIFLFLI